MDPLDKIDQKLDKVLQEQQAIIIELKDRLAALATQIAEFNIKSSNPKSH